MHQQKFFHSSKNISYTARAFQVVPNGNCTGVTSLTAKVSEFSETEPYKSVYKVRLTTSLSLALLERFHIF